MKMIKFNLATWTAGILILVGIFTTLLLNKRHYRLTNKSIASPKSISFILGEDKPGSNYFELATRYFSLSTKHKTDHVVTSCRTLACVIETINHQYAGIWDSINIIAHGNPDTGLNLYLDHNHFKATPKRLLQECLLKTLPKVDSNRINAHTKIIFWSCGIGNNRIVNLALQNIFSPSLKHQPSVQGTKKFIVFKERADNPCPALLEMDYYSYYYKRAHRPSNSEIIDALKKNYGTNSVDWNLALHQQDLSNNSGVFHSEYHLPISFTKIYKQKGDRPALKNWNEKKKWLLQQATIVQQLEDINIPFDKFHWQVHKVLIQNDEGKRVPAIKAIGMTTVLNILKQV